MKTLGSKFTRKMEEAVAALLTQRTLDDAARSIGIGTPRSVRPSIARLQQASSAAVSVLVKVMVDPASPPSCRVRAADSVLDHAAKAIEIEDIEVRASDLERAAQISRSGGKPGP